LQRSKALAAKHKQQVGLNNPRRRRRPSGQEAGRVAKDNETARGFAAPLNI
jgi:hypothetical protein